MKAIASLEAQVRRIRDKGVSQRELEEAVAYLTGRFPLRLEANAGMADILWAMEFYALGADCIERYGDYYRAVTVAQVNEAAARHLYQRAAWRRPSSARAWSCRSRPRRGVAADPSGDRSSLTAARAGRRSRGGRLCRRNVQGGGLGGAVDAPPRI